MTRLLIIVTILNLTLSSDAQIDFNEYSLLKSYSEIPKDFRQNFEETFYAQNERLNTTQIELLGDYRIHYLAYNSFIINEILKSGLVTFNDPISDYSSKLLDLLLKNDNELRKKIRIYTLKSTVANAYSTGDGIIFITIGLIAQLQNEAQLAYILAHEIVHITEYHHILEFLQRKDVLDKYSSYTNESKISKIFNYSKENELIADSKALEKYYLPADYSINEIQSLFDVLLYSYLPIDEITFDLSFFEGNSYKFPIEYKLNEYNEITAIENYDDSNSTHPNILKRRSAIITILGSLNNKNNKKFIVSENDFFYNRKIARYELSALYRMFNEPINALYNSYILLKSDPENKYLKTNVAESLYMISFKKSKSKVHSNHNYQDDTEGCIQQLKYLFYKMDRNEIELLSLRYAWILKNKYPNDQYICQMTDSIVKENAKNLSINLSDLQVDTLEILDSIQYENLSKTEKIKYNKKLNSPKEVKYYYYALDGLPASSEIFMQYHNYINQTNVNNSKDNLTDTGRKRAKIKKIILFSPFFEIQNDHISEKGISTYTKNRNEFINAFINSALKQNIQIDIFDINNLNINDIDQYNKYALLTLWNNEIYNGRPEILNGLEKYINKYKDSNSDSYYANIGVGQVSDGYLFYFVVFDPKSAEMTYSYSDNIKRLTKENLNSTIYKSLYTMNN